MANNTLEIVIKAQDYASKELKKLDKQVKKMSRSYDKTKRKLADFGAAHKQTFKNIGIAAGVAATAVVAVGKQFLDLGTQIELTQKKANTVFGEYITDIQKVASETAGAMGLSQNEYIKTAAGIQDLLIPMGFARDEATAMTTDVVGLAGALSEWSAGQYTAAEVGNILAKAMLGEREQLKSLGISITEADVQQRLLEMGMKDLTGVQLQQAKATATQQLIFEKSTDAQNAYKNGAGSLARQQAELSATIKDARDAVAIALIPALNELLKILTPIIKDISESTKAWAENKENIQKTTETLKSAITVLGFVKDAIALLIEAWYNIGRVIGLIVADIVIKISSLKPLFIGLKDTIVGVWDTVSEVTIAVFESIKETVTATIQGIIDFALGAVDKVKAAFEKVIAIKDKISSAVSSVASAVGGAISGARADGGPVTRGKTYLVGERGPELFTPNKSGNIIPNNKMGSSNITVNMGGVTVNNEADENRLVEKIKKALVTEAKLYNLGIT